MRMKARNANAFLTLRPKTHAFMLLAPDGALTLLSKQLQTKKYNFLVAFTTFLKRGTSRWPVTSSTLVPGTPVVVVIPQRRTLKADGILLMLYYDFHHWVQKPGLVPILGCGKPKHISWWFSQRQTRWIAFIVCKKL